jgi:G3E family GTPase
MNNGCICCTVRGDLIRILSELLKKKDKFDYVMIETTGLADPAPIAQTFMTVPKLARVLRMDGIITVVDAKHILQHLEEEKPEGVENESVEQVAFADKILLNKIDLVQPEDLDHVIKRIKSISSTVDIIKTQNSVVDLDKILNIRAFDLCSYFFNSLLITKLTSLLARIMDMDPEFLLDQDHEHDQSVSSVGILVEGEADINKLESWIGGILRELGADIFRMKGVIAIKGQAKRYVFQGVHMLFGGSPQLPWQAGEKRVNKMVFIGRNLNRAMLVDGFNACLVK